MGHFFLFFIFFIFFSEPCNSVILLVTMDDEHLMVGHPSGHAPALSTVVLLSF